MTGRTRARMWRLLLGGVVCGGAVAARAQEAPAQFASLVGSVRDSAGRPIVGVELSVRGGAVLARTNEAGGFRIQSLPVGPMVVSARRLGFAPASTQVNIRAGQLDSLVLSLTSLAASLPGVLVEDEYMARSRKLLAGFWSRRGNGFGTYLTRDEIEAKHATNFVDLFRQMAAVNVQLKGGRPTIRLRGSGGRDCPPQYFVDGIRIEQGSPDEFAPQDVEAVEVYSGPSTIPAQFTPRLDSRTCGAIVIWTRLPG